MTLAYMEEEARASMILAILDRSAKGEGVINIMRDLGFSMDEIYLNIAYLAENHQDEVKAAKRKSREN